MKTTRMHHMLALVTLVAGLATVAGAAKMERRQPPGTSVPLKEAKLIIEHNATDHDTGFQGFIDSEGWDHVELVGPKGA